MEREERGIMKIGTDYCRIAGNWKDSKSFLFFTCIRRGGDDY